MSEAEDSTLRSDGWLLHVRRWRATGPRRGTVAIVHGFGEHGGRYGDLAKHLVARGYETWAVDLRGHGRSEGPRAYVEDMEELVRDVERFLAKVRESSEGPLFLLGHSMGGCVSTLYILRRSPQLTGVVLSGPAIRLGEDFSPLKIKATKLLGGLVPNLPVEKLDSASVSRDPAVVSDYQNDPLVFHGWVRAGFGLAFLRAVEELDRRMDEFELPLFIVQGSNDKLVNKSGGVELHRRARSADKRIEIYEPLFHEVFNEPEKQRVYDDVTQWLDARAARPAEVEPRAVFKA